jgi:hypothetical protein
VDFQFIVDKIAKKLSIGQEKYVTTPSRTTLIKSVTTSQAIYPLTALSPPLSIMKAMLKLECAFLWAASDKVFGGKCRVKWDLVSAPKNMGGLEELDLGKCARALRPRWPWYEWLEPERAWVGLGHPCDDKDMELFYASINITVGDGKTANFWHAPWLDGMKPRDIASSLLAISRQKTSRS